MIRLHQLIKRARSSVVLLTRSNHVSLLCAAGTLSNLMTCAAALDATRLLLANGKLRSSSCKSRRLQSL